MDKHRCQYCSSEYAANFNLRLHVRKCHPGQEPPAQLKRGRKSSVPSKPMDCSLCKMTLPNRSALAVHRKKAACSPQSVTAGKQLLRRSGGSRRETLEFESEPEFLKWKTDEEERTLSRYVRQRSDNWNKDLVLSRRFYCHRSGHYAAKVQPGRKRHLKIQGSRKIGDVCPAAIFARISSAGKVSVSYYSEHQGHECDLSHHGLTKTQRSNIAIKLAAGIPYDDVLDTLRVSSTSLSYQHLISRQDIHNIAREFGVQRSEVLHRNDAESVAAWIHLVSQDAATQDLVRYIKFQGDESEQYPLPVQDFMLIIASDAQLVGARQFCGPMRALCMDSTHGLNGYNFQLTTLLAIDEHGEGFPVAFCFSSHVDTTFMTVFLDVVKTSIGAALVDVVLMTDDTEVYSNAWNAVMGPPAARLLCAWHVDRAWRRNLTKVRGDSSLKLVIYKTIRTLMEQPDRETFVTKMKEFLAAALKDDRTAEFATYFEQEYVRRAELWAYCHRLGLHVHHNMHLEAMHRVLKHVHLKGQKVRRMDKSIHALMRYITRLRKLHKGKWTRHTGGIRQRHKTGMAIGMSRCHCISENTVYLVSSSSDAKDTLYTVRQLDSAPPHAGRTCPLKCDECDVCVHTFSCTCLDSALRSTVCKHIHAIVTLFKPERVLQTRDVPCAAPDQQQRIHSEYATLSDSDDGAQHHDLDAETAIILKSLPENLADHDQVMTRIREGLQTLDQLAEANAEVCPAVLQHVTKLVALTTALVGNPGDHRLPELSDSWEPANKKAAMQRTFTAAGRQRKARAAALSKPTSSEKMTILEALTPIVEPSGSNLPPLFDHTYCELPPCVDALVNDVDSLDWFAAQACDDLSIAANENIESI